MAKRVSNKKAKQMISDVEMFRRNGLSPKTTCFSFYEKQFGYWVWIESGWFFRAVYFGTVSVAAEHLKNKAKYYCQCDNPDCGNWYEVSKVGVTCKECRKGKLYPQDVEPW
ncbi:hypothetical protein [Vibrio vulnificus]|uniref:hypothetical protein n=1 Tax=Vibrio vulnificus TaxID=672 RepID=UPI001FAE9D2B|nr:hypothetical protein [Vibrio vulnificus]MCJ0804077.1 hypothetical protein [Vibrio vulnificus]